MRLQLCALACVLIASIMGCATDTPSWQRYTQNDFPAPVHSVTTRLGNVLDYERDLTYSPWTVSFGKGIPYAFYNCRENRGCGIMIRNLKCDHTSSGRTSCELKLYDDANCDLVIPERKETLRILCPIELSLDPKLLLPPKKKLAD